MAKVTGIGTCDAPYKLPQSDVKSFIHNLFSAYPEIDKMINVFDNSQIKERHFSVPIDWFSKKHSFGERNKLYRDTALKMTKSAIEECLSRSGIEKNEINCIIMVSSTGIVTPTLDAILFNELGFDRHIRRIPIWGLGCAGGASGVSRAMDYVKANPTHNCLLVAIELCSLTFQKDDLSKSNVIAASLFSDGCAALLVSGNSANNGHAGITLVDSLSTIYNDSLDVMGWDVNDEGFRVIFSRDIPTIVKDYVKKNIEEIAQANNIAISDIKYFVTHPGGMKVIKAYEESLGLTNGTLNYSRKVLSRHGNMSAPSVLYVLKEFLQNGEFKKKGYGLLSSLGPGFSSELVLFKTP